MGAEIKVVNFDEMAMTPELIRNQVNVIQNVMKQVMKDGEHYGIIEGCGKKPTLLKPGAEKLSTTFRLGPTYQITRTELAGGHREYQIVCTLKHIPTGQTIGEGVGLCSSMESKYRWRNQNRKCPICGKESVIKGQAQYGGGWLCWKKKDGCGAKWKDGDPTIEKQECGKIENQDIADTFNTVLKMAKKRAHVDAVLTATAASDIFTQDAEDLPSDDLDKKKDAPPTQNNKSAYQNQQPPTQSEPQNQQGPILDPALMREAVLNNWKNDIQNLEQFLILKKWLKEGQTVFDLTDGQIKRIGDNLSMMMNLYTQWINSQL